MTEGRWPDLYKINFNESELQQIWELDTKSLLHLKQLQHWAQYLGLYK